MYYCARDVSLLDLSAALSLTNKLPQIPVQVIADTSAKPIVLSNVAAHLRILEMWHLAPTILCARACTRACSSREPTDQSTTKCGKFAC